MTATLSGTDYLFRAISIPEAEHLATKKTSLDQLYWASVSPAEAALT
jgi:hypothetical protein